MCLLPHQAEQVEGGDITRHLQPTGREAAHGVPRDRHSLGAHMRRGCRHPTGMRAGLLAGVDHQHQAALR
eukprot:1975004-Prorocentrum_lima.AAC.1